MSITTDTAAELEAELEAEERTLPGKRTRVTMPDGSQHTVRVTNRELVLWDKTAPRHKWGKATDVPFMARSFTTWAAARREELVSCTFDQWNDLELDLEDLPEDATDAARPTRTAPGADS